MNTEHIEKEISQLNSLVGKTVKSIFYQGTYSGPITIHFTDGTYLYVDAEGDDMSHVDFEIGTNPEKQ